MSPTRLLTIEVVNVKRCKLNSLDRTSSIVMIPISLGWSPDVPDLRDRHLNYDEVQPLPQYVDLREPQLELESPDCRLSDSSCAVSIVKLLDWQHRKWTGERLRGSAEFLHLLTMRTQGKNGVGLRSALKTLKRFGSPPPRLCDDVANPQTMLDRPEFFGFHQRFHSIQYLRLDTWRHHPDETLQLMKCWIANGNPLVVGFAVPHNFPGLTPVIPFDERRGGTRGGTACVVMGYDTKLATTEDIRTSDNDRAVTGAFLVHVCFDRATDHDGYFWLPFTYVETSFAKDAWAIRNPEWDW